MAPPFASLDFVYAPSRDVAAEARHLVEVAGAEHVFSIEAFGGTRVAMLRLATDGPALLLADHLDGERPILVHRVADLEAAMAGLRAAGARDLHTFEIPHGPGCAFTAAGGHRVAVYELTRPDVPERFGGRFDF
jgi:hypothetical protein